MEIEEAIGLIDSRIKTNISDMPTMSENEVKEIAQEELSKIIDDAPESFDTLKEIYDWIKAHESTAIEMNNTIQKNKSDIEELQYAKADKTEIPDVSNYLTKDGGYLNENAEFIIQSTDLKSLTIARNYITLNDDNRNTLSRTTITSKNISTPEIELNGVDLETKINEVTSGYARDNTKLPLTGGDINGNLSVSGEFSLGNVTLQYDEANGCLNFNFK